MPRCLREVRLLRGFLSLSSSGGSSLLRRSGGGRNGGGGFRGLWPYPHGVPLILGGHVVTTRDSREPALSAQMALLGLDL